MERKVHIERSSLVISINLFMDSDLLSSMGYFLNKNKVYERSILTVPINVYMSSIYGLRTHLNFLCHKRFVDFSNLSLHNYIINYKQIRR